MLISVLEILNKTEEFFKSKKVPNPRLDAQLLLCDVLKCKRLDLFLKFDKAMLESEISLYREYVKRRAKREPLQHILSEVDFFGLKLKSTKDALIPRSETEYLCELICEEYFKDDSANLNILDLGTGTGAIALSIANHFKNAKVVAVDFSDVALSLAKENAAKNDISNVEFIKSSWYENLKGKFDLIISNPPYLTQDEYETAQDEVKVYEPKNALVADNNGFSDIELIIKEASKYINEGGYLFLETGIDHSGSIKKLTAQLNLSYESFSDLNGYTRFAAIKF